ncbi:GNAT family N-acetyltransferase [Morganella psychrotolerans]|uniref:N-acetyltransferase domain-containing protein n=1 Tax=Morganella psychrotolerans TaxID=368603 RepID=A0A1B8H0N0_9GAMM|nr:GNAT family N-acetyltransferase [Morganella psychrotolerans]OBU02622.1 hypothetical protein AYY18_11445 [Morganella psychrotolerans]
MQASDPVFPAVITRHWEEEYQRGHVLVTQPSFRLMCRTDLEEGYDAMWLRMAQEDRIQITDDLAGRLRLQQHPVMSRDEFLSRIAHNELHWGHADQFFYLTTQAESALLNAKFPDYVRTLTAADEAIFTRLCAENNEDDLEIAGVEPDHHLVYGVFKNRQLVAAASAYPWETSRLMDIGVLTHPGYRKQGFASLAVRALSHAALQAGFTPQYRCQLNNEPSLALAEHSGFTPFAQWDFIIAGGNEA